MQHSQYATAIPYSHSERLRLLGAVEVLDSTLARLVAFVRGQPDQCELTAPVCLALFTFDDLARVRSLIVGECYRTGVRA